MEEQKCWGLVFEVPSQGSCEMPLCHLVGRASQSSLLGAREIKGGHKGIYDFSPIFIKVL